MLNLSPNLIQALAEISPVSREKAQAARTRYERRQSRLARQQQALQVKQPQTILDPIAKALAKAKALAERDKT
jgi:hypothetical protein